MIDQKRLAQLLGMLGSDHDGECLNAARLANKMVRAQGLTWDQVLAGGGYNEDFVKRVASEAYQAGRVAGAPKPPRKTFAGYAKLLLSKHADALSDWEQSFCLSWADKRFPPSDKQLAIFVRLSEKTGVPIPVELRDVG